MKRIKVFWFFFSKKNIFLPLLLRHDVYREAHIKRLEAELALLRASTSWKLTGPVRAVGRLLGRAPKA